MQVNASFGLVLSHLLSGSCTILDSLLLRRSFASPAATPQSWSFTSAAQCIARTHLAHITQHPQTQYTAHQSNLTHTQRWHMYVYSLRLCGRFRNNNLYLTAQQSTHACHTRLGSPLPFAHNSTPSSCRFLQECYRFPTGKLHD